MQSQNYTLSFIVAIVIIVFNLVWSIALLNWKKWGFYILLGSSVAQFIIKLSNGSIDLGIILGLLIVYLALNIGKNKAWPQLE